MLRVSLARVLLARVSLARVSLARVSLHRLSLVLAAAFAMFAAGLDGAIAQTVYLKAGRVIPIVGEEMTDATIVIEGGRIKAIGRGIAVPWDAKVIDASSKVVMPGMIEPHTSRGLRVTNEGMQTVPYLSVRDSLNAVDFYYEDRLRDGVVALNVMPGNATIIGGQGLVVKPHGLTVEDMTVRERSGMKVSLNPRRQSRMAHMQKLRKYLDDFRADMARREEKRKADAETAKAKDEELDPESPLDLKKKPLDDLLNGRMKAFVYCPTASDVFRAIELEEEYTGLDVVLLLGPDGYKAADVIAKHELPVIVNPALVYTERDEETLEETEHCAAAVFAEAGVKFAIPTSASSLGGRHLWFQAAVAMRHGVSRSDALKAITLWPAEILGIADRFGSIEVGKDANLAILTGDPLEYDTWVDRVLFEGKVIYDRAKDKRVARLFKAGPPKAPRRDGAKDPKKGAKKNPKKDETPGKKSDKKDGEPQKKSSKKSSKAESKDDE